ncbi:TFIIH basal transcription factor subunit [Trypanosoma vivax]|uniref:TFIIH basal transcription factor subunit n=1 Tax=Trypanosoma vivax (strain Y486) TaxID=1055687 RepID=G0TR26_TRYVY|nr:hypothetical protein TRVL_03252 [Trypanosoma vivax]KAH8611720.1 TFIIH basal transcription factor subunit [Trypanosoma vivax]CCC46390.1 conserved hypothetical protein [Trypanosoma vivax Y486]
MSRLSELLNTAQLTKYYELMQFLSSHVNTEYTLAQLDYLLPRGASLQRFPAPWVEFMINGHSGNQNIEMYYRPVCRPLESGGDTVSMSSNGQEELVIICRRPEIKSLEELSRLLQSPATVPDVEDCVALHTDQVILDKVLLRQSQERGMLYYFPDQYAKSRELRNVRSKRSVSAHGTALDGFVQSDGEAIPEEEDPEGRLNLPLNVNVHSMLYTHRGVPVRGRNKFPVRFGVGERALVVVERSSLDATNRDVGVATVNSASSEPLVTAKPPAVSISVGKFTSGGPGGEPPIEIRVRTSANPTISSRTFVDVRAQTKGKAVLSIHVDNRETIVSVEVLDECDSMPGVMIGREQQPVLPLPDDIQISDLGVCRHEKAGNPAAPQAESGDQKPSSRVLSWWLNPSPLVLEVRDAALPDNEMMTAASRAVWIPHCKDEGALRQLRKSLQEKHSVESTRRVRRKRGRNGDLRNSHMIHYGLDVSVPFCADGD